MLRIYRSLVVYEVFATINRRSRWGGGAWEIISVLGSKPRGVDVEPNAMNGGIVGAE